MRCLPWLRSAEPAMKQRLSSSPNWRIPTQAIAVSLSKSVKSPSMMAGVVSPLAARRRHESPHGNAFWQQTPADELIANDQEMKGWRVDLPINYRQRSELRWAYSTIWIDLVTSERFKCKRTFYVNNRWSFINKFHLPSTSLCQFFVWNILEF